MQTVYVGDTLINDVFLGSQRIDDTFTPLPAFNVEFLVVAAGGHGGSGASSPTRYGGGGGGGGLLSGSVLIAPYLTYQIQVGGFDANEISYASYLTGSNFYHYSFGGGNGGRATENGNNGGSGGGGGATTATSGGTGTSGQGFNGVGGVSSTLSGGGGGAAAAASGTSGGAGKTSSISGVSVTYSKGGDGNSNIDGVNYGDGGGGTTLNLNRNPANGVVILRYLAPQKISGGTVTTDGDYIVQTFINTNEGLGTAFTKYTFTYQ